MKSTSTGASMSKSRTTVSPLTPDSRSGSRSCRRRAVIVLVLLGLCANVPHSNAQDILGNCPPSSTSDVTCINTQTCTDTSSQCARNLRCCAIDACAERRCVEALFTTFDVRAQAAANWTDQFYNESSTEYSELASKLVFFFQCGLNDFDPVAEVDVTGFSPSSETGYIVVHFKMSRFSDPRTVSELDGYFTDIQKLTNRTCYYEVTDYEINGTSIATDGLPATSIAPTMSTTMTSIIVDLGPSSENTATFSSPFETSSFTGTSSSSVVMPTSSLVTPTSSFSESDSESSLTELASSSMIMTPSSTVTTSSFVTEPTSSSMVLAPSSTLLTLSSSMQTSSSTTSSSPSVIETPSSIETSSVIETSFSKSSSSVLSSTFTIWEDLSSTILPTSSSGLPFASSTVLPFTSSELSSSPLDTQSSMLATGFSSPTTSSNLMTSSVEMPTTILTATEETSVTISSEMQPTSISSPTSSPVDITFTPTISSSHILMDSSSMPTSPSTTSASSSASQMPSSNSSIEIISTTSSSDVEQSTLSMQTSLSSSYSSSQTTTTDP
ncbi:hypothetical protein DPMN_037693, partial [Dreissena polymorpha]